MNDFQRRPSDDASPSPRFPRPPLPREENATIPITTATGRQPKECVDNQKETLDDSQIRMRYFTLPVMLFHIQALRMVDSTQIKTVSKNSLEQSDSSSTVERAGKEDDDQDRYWETLGFLSLEFRSDSGLWWHLYHESPPGLLRASEKGKDRWLL